MLLSVYEIMKNVRSKQNELFVGVHLLAEAGPRSPAPPSPATTSWGLIFEKKYDSFMILSYDKVMIINL